MTATLDAADLAADESADATDTGTAPPERRPVPPSLQAWHDPQPWTGRLLTLIVAIAAGFTRFWALGSPPGVNHSPFNGMNFDEVYYATEAQELLRYGYEDNRGYMFIVHPPVGKWLIAAGEWFVGCFGSHSSDAYLANSLGWRVMPALFGCLGVVMIMRIARRMTRSNLFGFVAGALMVMEGMSLVLARTAILDIFLQTFVIAAFGALVIDRDMVRGRLAAMLELGIDLSDGVPTLGPRPWRVVAGVMIALACGVKWTGAFFFLAFVIIGLLWDRAALRAAGASRPTMPWLRRSVLPALGASIVTPVLVYLFLWVGWFAGENSWNRYGHDNFTTAKFLGVIPYSWGWLPGPLKWWWTYHVEAYRFHEGLDSGHAYQSSPWSWLVLGRPVDFYYNGSETTCGAARCARQVLLIGTPLMWWAFVPMLLWLGWHWFTTRDWRAGAVWIAFIAGWLTWFQDLKRTMFLFYMAPLVPFLVLGLTLALGMLLGPSLREGVTVRAVRRAERLGEERFTEADHRAVRRRTWGAAVVGGYLGLVLIDFVWMWPLFTGGLLTYDEWHAHIWLPSWV